MTARPTNRILCARLIDVGFDPENPEVLLELGMEHPVDWDAVDDAGDVICRRLDFVLTVEYVKVGGEPVGIHCVYHRVAKDHGEVDGLRFYALVLKPTRDDAGRECDRNALITAVDESVRVRRRSWCADIGEIRVRWRHAPDAVVRIENGSFVPEAAAQEDLRASDDEIQRLCAAMDDFCDAYAPPPEEAFEDSSPGLPLTDDDIEFVLDGALSEMPESSDASSAA